MNCANCGKEIAPDSNFCYHCGSKQEATVAAPLPMSERRLRRSNSERVLAGVCGGFAEYFGLEVTLIRIIWVLTVLLAGTGILAYIICWIVIPLGGTVSAVHAGQRRLMRSYSDRKLGGVCGGLAEYLNTDPTVVRLLWVVLGIVPGAFIGGIIAYLVAWMVIPQRQPEAYPNRAAHPATQP